ncbi:hypothetical protein TCAL_03968 [Tigriopus californicus]|uniref:Uncharacterized protein n=1 Tax=Tigriopus californicus TaxID=6832 RepID=A0A553P3A1_TIGCA|nr:ras-like GTP-binding protein RhoL [Tigriopus californicus]TRY72176.1 hypothetical protein TCAL_03968 [Tigriopus californicus]|eukprot:TCALIF_03968-PA protein Name:"Similar to RhoL Ras-like GTP-binding protein RhoL (Drosophila melanogaster)" AED:0.26 eAED:0.26 QI:46/1/0.5/1/1/1/2/0/180
MGDEIEYFLKLTVVGDHNVGKTALLETFTNGGFIRDELPKLFSSNTVTVEEFSIDLWDTDPSDKVQKLRPITYTNTCIFLICFSIDNASSHESVTTKWVPEIRKFSSKIPFMIVGTKTDLRTRSSIHPDVGKELAEAAGAVKYMECSAIHNDNVQEVFLEAARLSDRRSLQEKSKTCVLL